ncbi:MAG TPA: hypothetical protein VGN81_36160 [Pseudonocardiaceae bacterium]
MPVVNQNRRVVIISSGFGGAVPSVVTAAQRISRSLATARGAVA